MESRNIYEENKTEQVEKTKIMVFRKGEEEDIYWKWMSKRIANCSSTYLKGKFLRESMRESSQKRKKIVMKVV